MIRNQTIAIVVQMVLGGFVWFLLGFVIDILARWHTQTELWSDLLFLVIAGGSLIVYEAAGKRLLRRQGSRWRNALSVSGLAVIITAVWVWCYFLSEGGFSWVLYMLVNAPLYSFIGWLQPNGEWLLLPLSFVPSFMLWLGVERQ